MTMTNDEIEEVLSRIEARLTAIEEAVGVLFDESDWLAPAFNADAAPPAGPNDSPFVSHGSDGWSFTRPAERASTGSD